MTSPTEWLKVLQLKPRFLFGLGLVGMLLLFFPDGWAAKFGFRSIVENYRGWIGLGTIVSFAFWLVQLVPSWRQTRALKKHRQDVIHSLSSLSSEEAFLLGFCLHRNQRTLTLEMTHRAANALKAKGLLQMASGIGNQLAWAFTVPDFVWEHLCNNPQIIFPNKEYELPNVQARFNELDRQMRRYDNLFSR